MKTTDRGKKQRKTVSAGISLAALVLAAGLGGCGRKNTENPSEPGQITECSLDDSQRDFQKEPAAGPSGETGAFSEGRYDSPDGLYSLPLSENDWQVEQDDDGDLLFINKKDDKTVFSASMWENTAFPPDTDYKSYYERYLEGIREVHPEAEETAFDTPAVGTGTALYMGIRFHMDEEAYRVLTYLIPFSDGQDILSFTMTVPEAGADTSEKEFRGIVEGMETTSEKGETDYEGTGKELQSGGN